MLIHGDKIGIVCCSNGQKKTYTDTIKYLENKLKEIGLQPVFSDYIYEKESVMSKKEVNIRELFWRKYET